MTDYDRPAGLLTVRTESGFDTPIHQCAFTTRRGEWEEHRLAFTDFVPTFRGRAVTDAPAFDPTQGGSVGFLISDKQAGPFRLDVAWIIQCVRRGSGVPARAQR